MDTTEARHDYRESNLAMVALAAWTLGWLATLALARFGPDLLWGSQATWSWIAVATNLLVGAGVIVAFQRFLSRADELDRKIMLDALAVTLGVAWVTGFAYVVAHAAELVAIDIAVLLAAPGLVLVFAVVVGKIRYR